MTDVDLDPGEPVTCRYCGSAGTIRPDFSGARRPELTWAGTECRKRQHKPTSDSMVAAADAWWKREKARRQAADER